MNRLTGYEVMMDDDGNVLQSGARSMPANQHIDVGNTAGWITRGVILQTYYADEDDRSWVADGGQRYMLCDVRTYGRYSRVLTKVPFSQSVHGLHDRDIYTPRPSRINTTGGSLVTDAPARSSPQNITPAEDCDGDHVLIGFIDNDPVQPIILRLLAHPNSKYTPTKEIGRVREIAHNGIKITWDKDSNFTIDATGAAKDELDSTGNLVSVSGTNGKITLKTNNGSNDTSLVFDNEGSLVAEAAADIRFNASDEASLSADNKVYLGKWGATESVILGDKYNAAEQKLWGASLIESSEQEKLPPEQGGSDRGSYTIGDGLSEFFAAFEEWYNGSGALTALTAGAWPKPTGLVRMKNALSSLFDLIEEFKSNKSTWLSQKVKTE